MMCNIWEFVQFQCFCVGIHFELGLLCGSVLQNLPAMQKDENLIPGPERSPGEGNGNLLQYSCLGNPMDRGT